MNKEFIGKKRFYLEDHPETYMDVRLYVVETRSSEYITAVLEDGNAYTVELVDSPCEELSNVKSFIDLENRLFLEYPTQTISGINFFDRKGNEIGEGELTIVTRGSVPFYIGEVTTTRAFKYKRNGWDFEVDKGERIAVPMQKDSESVNIFLPYMRNNQATFVTFSNRYHQIGCSASSLPKL